MKVLSKKGVGGEGSYPIGIEEKMIDFKFGNETSILLLEIKSEIILFVVDAI